MDLKVYCAFISVAIVLGMLAMVVIAICAIRALVREIKLELVSVSKRQKESAEYAGRHRLRKASTEAKVDSDYDWDYDFEDDFPTQRIKINYREFSSGLV